MTQSEKEVANLLKELGIQWSYEQPVFVWDENKRPRVWAPDFFLIHFGIYIEPTFRTPSPSSKCIFYKLHFYRYKS